MVGIQEPAEAYHEPAEGIAAEDPSSSQKALGQRTSACRYVIIFVRRWRRNIRGTNFTACGPPRSFGNCSPSCPRGMLLHQACILERSSRLTCPSMMGLRRQNAE